MDKDRIIICLLCEEKFEYPRQKDEFLVHLTCEHRFIIANVETISDLPSYIAYWRNKFVQAKVVTDYCKAVKMKSGEGQEAIEEDFFVASLPVKNIKVIESRRLLHPLHYVFMNIYLCRFTNLNILSLIGIFALQYGANN